MSEYELHVSILSYLRIALPEGSAIHHSPNEGAHKIAYRMKQKRQGVIAGWPDLEIFVPPAAWTSETVPWCPIFLEIKTPKGRVSENQKAAHKLLTSCGCAVAVVRSIEETAQAVGSLVLLREKNYANHPFQTRT